MSNKQIEAGKAELLKNARLCCNKAYTITVNNEKANSHNINIDCPTFFCFALSDAEAIGLMMLSDFSYKHLPIMKIHKD